MDKKFKKVLPKGYSVNFDCERVEITEEEIYLISYWIKQYDTSFYKLPTLIPINDKIHLDFIGWKNDKYKDVLICKSKKRLSL